MSTEQDEPSLFNVAVSLARVEAKVDQVLTVCSDHEARLRAVEQRPDVVPRVVALEARQGWLHRHAVPLSALGALLSATGTFVGLALR